MSPQTPACTVILIHGLGDQSEDWSTDFRTAFTTLLGTDAERIALVDAYWAPLSKLKELVHPTFGLGGGTAGGLGLQDETYNRAVLEFTRALGRDAGLPQDTHALGPGEIFSVIQGKLPGGKELIVDVANYVSRNGVRSAVQNVLHARLAEAQQAAPGVPIVLVSHSQGTIIAYDVLRQAGESYPALRTWITMGCPLNKYLSFPFEWGGQRLGVPEDLRWVNLFDPADLVGVELSGLLTWTGSQLTDVQVNNVQHASDAHDHWHNPEVVQQIKAEVLQAIGN